MTRIVKTAFLAISALLILPAQGRTQSESFDAHLSSAQTQRAAGDFAAAEQSLRTALTERPNDPQALRLRALMLAFQDKLEEAHEYADKEERSDAFPNGTHKKPVANSNGSARIN